MTNAFLIILRLPIGMMGCSQTVTLAGLLLSCRLPLPPPPLPCLDNHRYMDGNRLTSLEVGLFDNNPKLWLVYVDQGIDGV